MTGYLGRLVDRAVGPTAPGLRLRLAPVFPLGRQGRPAPAPLDGEAPSDEVVSAADARVPSAQAPLRLSAEQAPDVGRPSVIVRQANEQPAAPAETRAAAVEGGAAAATPERLVRPDDRAPSGQPAPRRKPRPETGQTRPVAGTAAERRHEPPTAVAHVRVERQVRAHDLPTPAREAQRPPQIDVHIGRVEVRRPSEPQPVEWPEQGPVAVPAPRAGFGELAAARRYVDRGWS